MDWIIFLVKLAGVLIALYVIYRILKNSIAFLLRKTGVPTLKRIGSMPTKKKFDLDKNFSRWP